MYLHEAFAKSDLVQLPDGCWRRKNDDMPLLVKQAISNYWEPVFEKVGFIEAVDRWKKFRRRSWVDPYYYLYFDHTYLRATAPEVYLNPQDCSATDWEEYHE